MVVTYQYDPDLCNASPINPAILFGWADLVGRLEQRPSAAVKVHRILACAIACQWMWVARKQIGHRHSGLKFTSSDCELLRARLPKIFHRLRPLFEKFAQLPGLEVNLHKNRIL
ncbi:hypothetical protein GH984_07410 [Spiribacter sp. C176]|uniref:Uncharacterized protein n=1 Tax=Spiribacter salilacus TaxID=2664894 RepID=A0A6N7QQ42_9GAMM|nr:hypothetical protein [Spiribacter salilacus]